MKAIKLLLLASTVVFGSAALAAQPSRPAGDTSGPAVGTPVQPSTVIQKENPHVTGRAAQSEAAAGAPGVESAPGTEAGPVPKHAPAKRN